MTTAARGRTGGEVEAADEDVFDPTPAQRKELLYRAGGLLAYPGSGITPVEAAARAEACLREYYGAAVQILWTRGPQGSHEQPPEPGAVGDLSVAVAAALLAARTDFGQVSSGALRRHGAADATALVEHWYLTRGIEFIVEVVLLACTEPMWSQPFGWDWAYGSGADLRRTLGLVRNRLSTYAPGDLGPVFEIAERFRASDSCHARVVTSVLLPGQHDWVEGDIATTEELRDTAHAAMLTDSVRDLEQLARLGTVLSSWPSDAGSAICTPGAAITLIDGLGLGIAPTLGKQLDYLRHYNKQLLGPVIAALGAIPTDTAFTALARRTSIPAVTVALRQVAERFPRRALRLLDPVDNVDALRELVHKYPDLARTQAPQLSPATAALVAAELEAATGAVPVATNSVPEILRTPPWTRKRPKPAVLSVSAPAEVRCAWLPGERAEWLGSVDLSQYQVQADRLERITATQLYPFDLLDLLAAGPGYTRPLLPAARLRYAYSSEDSLRAFIATYENEAYPLVVDIARRFSREIAHIVLPYESAELVMLATQWLERRTLRSVGTKYLRRHASFAARVLIPAAVGGGIKDRRVGGRTLRMLAELGDLDEILAAAKEYGAEVVKAVDVVLATDPTEVLPARMPTIPPWVNLPALPPITVDSGEALPASAVEHLLTMLLLSVPGEPYAGLEPVKQSCDTRALADFVWALYQQWWQAGAPTKNTWIYEAVGALGDDDTVALLLADIRERRSDARSVSALDIFVTLGTDAALLALKTVSEKVKTPRVREGARVRITEIADRMGLTADQLADRLVPDLGLSADGTLTLDFGPRRFVIGFDEQLRPTISTGDGKSIKALPKPGVNDDTERAEQAHSTFRKVKKNARALAADQITRMERAMVGHRRFTVEELRELFIAHPLRWNITRRVVWGVYDGDKLVSTFRIAEDRTFADSDDETVTLPDDAELGIPHPVQFADVAAAWGEVFADYELLQPFPQLGRDTYTAPTELLAAHEIPSDGTQVDSARFLGLPARGWLHPQNTDGAHMCDFEKPLPGGRFLWVWADPGLMAWDMRGSGDQTFHVRLCHVQGKAGGLTFTDLDEVTLSEVLRDIAWLKAGAL